MIANRTRLWYYRIETLIALAVLVHGLAVWALPRFIMSRVTTVASASSQPGDRVVFPPLTDHLQRRVVMPSPDLLYALCPFDVARQPLRIRANPKTPQYWSIALYAANSDNFFVINDRQAAGQPVDIVLNGPDAYAQRFAMPAGAQTVNAPSASGLMLMRVLVTDYAREREVVEAARRSLQCDPLEAAS